MNQYFNTKLSRLKLVAGLEGISFLLLVGVAVPLKYIWHMPQFSSTMGMVHGITFVLYIFNLIQAKIEYGWRTGLILVAILASFIPFAPFFVMTKMLPGMERNTQKVNENSVKHE